MISNKRVFYYFSYLIGLAVNPLLEINNFFFQKCSG